MPLWPSLVDDLLNPLPGQAGSSPYVVIGLARIAGKHDRHPEPLSGLGGFTCSPLYSPEMRFRHASPFARYSVVTSARILAEKMLQF